MKVLVLGASGIIGQNMRLCCPEGLEPIYARRKADRLHLGIDVCGEDLWKFLDLHKPAVIVNLAGESNTDIVEQFPSTYIVNAVVPGDLAAWCDLNESHLVHVSTQAVFKGDAPPYYAGSERGSVNAYGMQKIDAEQIIQTYKNWTIVRPTFVLGIRPLPHVGRPNPLEQILAGQRKQVDDRWFSISLAREVAELLWHCAVERSHGVFLHIGEGRLSRYELARRLGCDVEPVSHDSFPGIAPRPIDTHYSTESDAIMERLKVTIKESSDELLQRARQIAMFLGKREDECARRLNQGWEAIHNAVTADWNAATPKTDDEILAWYRNTESYIWELSWYHADAGFNYAGMCGGIAVRLGGSGAKKVLCLGDGIGDLTIGLLRRGFDATYHDLKGSRTAEFADFRAWMLLGREMPTRLSAGWEPDLGAQEWDAIVSLDFLEHVTDVPAWCAAIRGALKPGGLLVAQNAFAMGSGESGAMPMHLARNDRFEKDWDPLLLELGFSQLSSNWYVNNA